MSPLVRKRLVACGFICGGALILWFALFNSFWRSGQGSDSGANIWTCSMHPQVRLDHSGRCPICGMDLVPVGAKPAVRPAIADHAGSHLTLDAHAQQMARVETTLIQPQPLFKEIRAAGKIEFDESTLAQITARIEGRVDVVYANFPGTVVKQGDHLVSIYSPDLLSTQNELLESFRQEKNAASLMARELTASSRKRLELWGVTPQQIDELLRTGRPSTDLVVSAPRGGTVVKKNIQVGQYARTGDLLFSIADLSHVWLIVDIYESELSWVRFGQPVDVSLESSPGHVVRGTIGFIEPVLNDATRTLRVRVILQNPAGVFKPGMYAQANIRVAIMPDGSPAPTGLEGKFTCPMHPYVVADTAGKCPVCGMPLEKVPGQAAGDMLKNPPQVLAVPAAAVLNTGRRQLVYVEQESGLYHLVEPKLGPRAGDYYPVLGGLQAGQRVVSRGNFLLDSQFQITGNPSLLYPEGILGGGVGHAGHGGSTPAPAKGDAPPQAYPHAGHRKP